MKGLFLKDFYNLRQTLVWYAICIVGFAIVAFTSHNMAFIAGIGVFLTVSIPTSAMAYDERDKWHKYARACGIKPTELVWEKYLLSSVAAGGTLVILTIFNLISSEGNWLTTVTFVSLALLTVSLMLPFLFKYGTEKGRVFLIVAMLAVMALSVGLVSLIDGSVSAELSLLFIILLPVVAVAAVIFSANVSIKIINKKDM